MIVRPPQGPGPKKATAVLTRGERVIAFAERFLRVPEGALVGQPIRLEEFQRKFILDVYDNPAGTSKAILSIARKNGKSAIIACILLAHLVGPEAKLNSQIVSGAMSRDQAALVFNLAVKMVQLSPDIRDLVHVSPSGKKLTGKPLNVEYKALSAEAATTHGLSPILAILDEIGQVRGPQSDFIDAVTTAQGAHDGKALVIAISTQAATDADLLSIWIDDALKSGDPRIVCHLYAADPDAELDDPKGWQAANPALGIFRSRQDVEQQAAEAKRMPSRENTFRNLILNQRVSTVSPFVSRDVWKSCAGEPVFAPGSQVFGGLDLSARTDLTAFVIIGRREGKWHSASYFWTPQEGLKDRAKRDRVPYDLWAEQGYLRTTPGRTVDYEVVAADILEIVQDYEVHSIAYDRWRIDLLKKEFKDIGIDADTPSKDGGRLPLVPHGQGFKDFSPALDALEAELVNGRVVHDDNPVLTMCAANAVVQKDPSGNRKLDKAKATGRIDGMVAMGMAFGATVLAAADLEPERSFQLLVF
jgi:phage terminase large subunit-like protein